MPSQEGPANLLVSAVDMQRAQWLVPFDSMLPPWASDVALTLPSLSNMGADIDMYGSGVSSGKMCCVNSITFPFVRCLYCEPICGLFAWCSGWLLVGSAEVMSGAASGILC